MNIKRASILLLATAAVATSACVISDAAGPRVRTSRAEITVDVFYDSLDPFGRWVEVDFHGWVWIPDGVGREWHPYTQGYWIHTPAGWTWLSEWRWGWAPFHYGRWMRHSHHGWVWIPGTVWAPAWVAWRRGDGWIGWAPLPVGAGWTVGVGLDLGSVDLAVAVRSGDWSFVPDHRFLDRRWSSHRALETRHADLIEATRLATRYEPDGDGRAVDRGIRVERIERVRETPVSRYRIRETDAPPERPTVVKRDRVKVYRPKVKKAKSTRVPRKRDDG